MQRQSLAVQGVKATKYAKHPVEVRKALHVLGPYYGIKPQYQRAEVIPGGDCETVADFTEETSGQLDVAAVGAGRVGANSIRLTQTVAASDAAVYLLLDQPVDLRYARYVGFWFAAGAADQFDPGDISLYIFTRDASNFLYADRAMALDIFETQYIDGGGAVWRYMEMELARFIRATGFESEDLSEVWGIGFQSIGGDNGNLIDVDQIEFYTHGTGYGPARGNIISVPLTDDAHAIKGYAMAWDETAGRVNVAIDNEPAFAGICVDNPSETRLAATGAIGDTTITVLDASLFEVGTATLWDDTPSTEAVTISAVNRVTNELTISALAAEYAVADNAKIAMEGTETGSIRVDVMTTGVANMLAEDGSIGANGEGVSMSQAGATPMIDDGGANSQDIMIGKALEVATATEVIPVLLGMPGVSA